MILHDIFQARVNIPGLSARKMQKDIAAGDFTATPEIQVNFDDEYMVITHLKQSYYTVSCT